MAKKLISYDNEAEGLGLPEVVEGRLDTAYTSRVGEVHGGQVLAPVRVPHLVADDSFPKPWMPNLIVLWADPTGTMYASSRDRSFYKSTNHGKSWSYRGKTDAQIWHPQCFLLLQTGTLLAIAQNSAVIRSEDDGATWQQVHNSRAGTNPMGPTSWCEDQHGHIYFGEYQTNDSFQEIHVYRSTDDGATFEVFHAFPGPATNDPLKTRHIHGVQYDKISQRVYVMTGDSEPASGIYRTNDSSNPTTLERVVTNEQLSHLAPTQARAIGMMFFPNYLAWGVDGTQAPNILRMHRDQIGVENPEAEIIYRVNATSWFTTDVSEDGTTWLLSASREGVTAIDKATHLYAVEEEGSRVWEVGSFPQGSSNSNGGLAPLGSPQHGSDRVWLQSYNNFEEDGSKRHTSVAVRLARGTQPLQVTQPPIANPVIAWQSVSSGPLNFTESNMTSPVTIGVARCAPSRRNRLIIYDWAVRRTAGSGTAILQIYDIVAGEAVWQSHTTGTEGSRRSSQGREDSAWLEEIDLSGRTRALEFRVFTTTNFTGVAQMTYGWGG